MRLHHCGKRGSNNQYSEGRFTGVHYLAGVHREFHNSDQYARYFHRPHFA